MTFRPATTCRYCEQPLAAQNEVTVCGRCLVLRNMMRLRPDASWRILHEIVTGGSSPIDYRANVRAQFATETYPLDDISSLEQ